jgi:tRNA A37 threonylcarbamoyladenosine synthetase subunit TsaC/SUA5/YrdC
MSERAALIQALAASETVTLPVDSGAAQAVDLFQRDALVQLRAAHPSSIPVVLAADTEHIDALAADLSADTRVAIQRCLPGPLALGLRPTGLVPCEARFGEGLVAVSVPAHSEAAALIREFGHPLLAISIDAVGPTILDMTRRPARIVRAGLPERVALERYLLLEEDTL